jgi:hypothetical protein
MTEQVSEQENITFQDQSKVGQPIMLPLEVALLFGSDMTNLGFYVRLLLLSQSGILDNVNQQQLAKLLNITPQWLIPKLKTLISLGLLVQQKKGKDCIYKIVNPVLPDETILEVGRLKNTLIINTIKENFNYQETAELLDKTSKSSAKRQTQFTQNELSLANIYNYNTSTPKPKNILTSKVKLNTPPKKPDIKRFPKIWYNMVLTAYAKHSGVERVGPELSWAHKATRNMFLAGRKPQEIIKFMEWLAENNDNPEFKWLKFWTMDTVRKRLPDFLAGKLTGEEDQDDGFRQLN